MNIIIIILIFILVLFIYLHIFYHLKTSDDLEVYELASISKERLEEICDLRQPLTFHLDISKFERLTKENILQNYPSFDIKLRDISSNNIDTELFLPIILTKGYTVLSEDTIILNWSGNELVVDYSYNFNSQGWSDWTTDTSLAVSYLDENDYTFEVKGRYITEDEDDTPAEASFTVDAVSGPGLRIYPLYQTINVGDNEVVSLFLEEVTDISFGMISIEVVPVGYVGDKPCSNIKINSIAQGDLIADGNNEEPLDQVEQKMHQEQLGKWLSHLSEQEQHVLKLRFGLDANERHTLAEIGRLLEVSRERVRQVELKALRKLRNLTRKLPSGI